MRQIAVLLVLVIICLSCSIFNSDTTLIVKNQSNSLIDSAVFNVNGFKQKIIDIGILSEKRIEVPQKLIPNNKHHVITFVSIYLNGGKILKSQDYNDLTGSPGKSITAIIDKDLNLILKPEW